MFYLITCNSQHEGPSTGANLLFSAPFPINHSAAALGAMNAASSFGGVGLTIGISLIHGATSLQKKRSLERTTPPVERHQRAHERTGGTKTITALFINIRNLHTIKR